MGLIEANGIMVEVSKVFDFFRVVYEGFPTVVKLLMFSTFGSIVFIGMLRGVGR